MLAFVALASLVSGFYASSQEAGLRAVQVFVIQSTVTGMTILAVALLAFSAESRLIRLRTTQVRKGSAPNRNCATQRQDSGCRYSCSPPSRSPLRPFDAIMGLQSYEKGDLP